MAIRTTTFRDAPLGSLIHVTDLDHDRYYARFSDDLGWVFIDCHVGGGRWSWTRQSKASWYGQRCAFGDVTVEVLREGLTDDELRAAANLHADNKEAFLAWLRSCAQPRDTVDISDAPCCSVVHRINDRDDEVVHRYTVRFADGTGWNVVGQYPHIDHAGREHGWRWDMFVRQGDRGHVLVTGLEADDMGELAALSQHELFAWLRNRNVEIPNV